MKKLLLTIAVAVSSSFALSAQANYTITDSLGNDLVGTTVSYNVASSQLDSRGFTVTNMNSTQVNIKVQKTIIVLNDPGSTVYFCTGSNCYSPSQTLSLTVPMTAAGTMALTCDHFPNNMTGVTQVRYTVINQANANDTASFTINYTSVPTGIATHTAVKPSISNPSPNPASSMFSINYKMGTSNPAGAKMVVYNMLGDRVMETIVEETEGVVKMDVSSLEQGIYFCSLESDGKTFATRRLVVTH
jgi:hypothetical protein